MCTNVFSLAGQRKPQLAASSLSRANVMRRLFVAACTFMTCALLSPAQAAVIGNIDGISNGRIAGWAFDSNAKAAPLNISVYLDGPQGVGRPRGTFATNAIRGDVNKQYGVSGSHGFSWSLAAADLSSLHIWFVYATGADGKTTLLANGPVVYPSVSVYMTGSPETVVDYAKDACEPMDIPDHPARAFRTSDGKVTLVASHRDARLAVGASLDTVKHQCPVVHTSERDPTFDNFKYYQWLQAPYTLDGKTVYSITHNEWYGSLVSSACKGHEIDSWVSAVTMMTSTDGGKHFSYPTDYVVRKPQTPWSSAFPCTAQTPTRYGDLGGSNIIFRAGYYYKFFIYEPEPGVVPYAETQCVMRTNNLANASSWSVWNGSGWDNSKTAPCAPVPTLRNARSVTFNTYLHMYVATQWFGASGYAISLSWDLLNWSAPIAISTPGLDTSIGPYPSLLDPKDTSQNFEMTSRNPYLYFTRIATSTRRDLMRIPLNISVGAN